MAEERKDKRGKKRIERLLTWKEAHGRDPAYIERQRTRERRRMAQLKADAAFGRMARELLGQLASLASLGGYPEPDGKGAK